MRKGVFEASTCTNIRDSDQTMKLHNQGPVVQSIVSLTSLSVVEMFCFFLVSTMSNSQVFLLKKMWVAFANAKATHIFFSKNISIYAIFNDQGFNITLTNDIVSFEQLGTNKGFCCMLVYFIVFINSVSRQWQPWSDYANEQTDLFFFLFLFFVFFCLHIPRRHLFTWNGHIL